MIQLFFQINFEGTDAQKNILIFQVKVFCIKQIFKLFLLFIDKLYLFMSKFYHIYRLDCINLVIYP